MPDKSHRSHLGALLSVGLAWFLYGSAVHAQEEPRLPLSELRESINTRGRVILSFRLEGTVCAASEALGLVALQDETGTELLELPSLPQGIAVGQSIEIESEHCPVTRGAIAIRLGTGPVVDLDEVYAVQTRTGATWLKENLQPLRVEWYNNYGAPKLVIEYEREGKPRQRISPEMLFHRGSDSADLSPGLGYAVYAGGAWRGVPDFSMLQPQEKGVIADFDLGANVLRENVGIVFEGYLRVPATGRYDFNITSDDGSRVFVGRPEVRHRILEAKRPTPLRTSTLTQAIVAGSRERWVTAEGTVNFASWTGKQIELELTDNSNPIRVVIADPAGKIPADFLRKSVQVTGLRRSNGLVAVSAQQLRVTGDRRERDGTLSRAFEVRQLPPNEARKPYRAEIEGVVTNVSPRHVVLQDDTGGVFIHYACPTNGDAPQVGELWRIAGNTAPGDFSPVIHADRASFVGHAPLPKPARPTREQLASGSLDAEEVEIEGVVTALTDAVMTLLTPNGTVTILDNLLYPLPTAHLTGEEKAHLPGSVIRLRGVYTASWDSATGRVRPAEFRLGDALMAVEEATPADPFTAPSIRAADLLLFTSQSSVLKRVRVGGLLLHAAPPEFMLFDGTKGFRIISHTAVGLKPGDQVEASGFPQLGGPSPVLLEASARKTGSAPFPAPATIRTATLPDARLDSTLVNLDATLLSDTMRRDERALEMSSGSSRFMAYVPADATLPKRFDKGSVLRLTGVYVSSQADGSSPGPDPFELRLADASQLQVIYRGPWWTTRHTITVISILSGGLLLASVWVTVLRRTVTKRSAELAREIESREALERHRVVEQERSRVAQDLHDELGSGLTEAGILTSLVQNPGIPQEQKAGYLEQLSEVCCTMVTGLDEIVWAVNPRYDSAADLAGYFSLFAQRFLGIAGINCRFKIDDAIPAHPLDSRMRHGIFLAFKEALNNIVKHSGATEVHLSVQARNRVLQITLSDNGRGFGSAAAPPGSDGLSGIESRMRELGGSSGIETKPGQGTEVRLLLPLEKSLP
ncbi:ATP-binding protein [Luteolibacter luteus]|uniref:histidine kinase n=1 Tax=Luteolibacter luteus TaxID=2728835 RepID=A0A858RPC6_9BACT|nr:ATP-binding protein [Luteolibacter luteus]QJE98712.1 hypothetical protein HHL09_23985 [Luteolibacter luteus]